LQFKFIAYPAKCEVKSLPNDPFPPQISHAHKLCCSNNKKNNKNQWSRYLSIDYHL